MASALIEEKVEHLFAKAIKELDIDLLHRLIKPIGEYDAQDEKLEIIHLSKEAYIEWIVNKRRKIEDIDYYFDQCLLCSIGNTVVIFNDGYFPHKVKENAGQSKAGLMLNVTDGQIDTIKFCYTFLNTKNMYHFEVLGARMKTYMAEHNCNALEAAEYVLKEDQERP